MLLETLKHDVLDHGPVRLLPMLGTILESIGRLKECQQKNIDELSYLMASFDLLRVEIFVYD